MHTTKKLLPILLIITFITNAHAGGDASPVKVISFISDTDDVTRFTMTVRYFDDGKGWEIYEFDDCDQITVNGFYDYDRWRNYRRPMTARGHRQSMAYLMTAMQMNKVVYFGAFGHGLVKKTNCEYESRGLFREFAVYSVNGRI